LPLFNIIKIIYVLRVSNLERLDNECEPRKIYVSIVTV